jgi:hypothetical protein
MRTNSLPNGQRRCMICKLPFLTGSSPVPRTCRSCHLNPPGKAMKGQATCNVCRVRFKAVGLRNTYCSNICCNIAQRERRDSLRGRLNLCLQKARKRRNCDFDLVWLLAQWERQNGLCYYTAWPMELKGPSELRPTLERLDSSEDYTETNTVICCKQANWAKNNYTLEQFVAMCRAVTAKFEK